MKTVNCLRNILPVFCLTWGLQVWAAPAAPVEIVSLPDVVYGRVQGAGLLADVAYPKAGRKLPVILSVHGGRWRAGHKRDTSAIKVEEWAGRGFFSMSIDYRLVGGTPAPACYQDLLCAIRFLHAHAGAYSIDTNRIFLIGQSAGGHLVTLAGMIGGENLPRTGGWENAPEDFRAVISVAAPYDLTTLDWGKLWAPAGVDPAVGRAEASPIRHISKRMKPLLIIHADNDTSVPIGNVLPMVKALEEAGAPFRFFHSRHLGHMQIVPEVIEQAVGFIGEYR